MNDSYPHEFEEDILANRRIHIRPMYEQPSEVYAYAFYVSAGLVFGFTFLAALAALIHFFG